MANGAKRTDPRIDRTRRAVIEAVGALLADEGAASITHQRVAEVSGVGRATLYRHWPTAAEMLYDVLTEVDRNLLRPGEGPLVDWLRHELVFAANEIGQPTSIQFIAILVGRAELDTGAAALRQEIVDEQTRHLAGALARAHAAGEIVDLPDARVLLAQLLGPILFRVLVAGEPADEAFVDTLIAHAVGPWLPGSETT